MSFIYSDFEPAAVVVQCGEDGAVMLSTSSSDILLDCHVREGVCIDKVASLGNLRAETVIK